MNELNRKRISEAMKGKRHSDETKRKISESKKGKHHTEESKRKMSESRMGVKLGPHSDETKRKISEANKGRPSHMKGKKTGKSSWNKGIPMRIESKKRLSESLKGKTAWNKGIKGTHFSPRTEFKKGNTPWHKGKTGVYSKERLEQWGISHKKTMENPEIRKKISESQKKRYEKVDVWHKGKTGVYTKEMLKKMSENQKKMWENPEIRKRISESLRANYRANPELRKKMSERQKKYMANPEVRERLRKHTLKMYESGSFPKQTNTKIEIAIKDELLKRGYKEGTDFIHQFKFMDKFMCDFCFPNEKVIVEADGDFWHCNPKIYPDGPTHPHQIKGIKKDKSKKAYITKVDNGSWNYLTIWESDINNDVSGCVDKIELALNH